MVGVGYIGHSSPSLCSYPTLRWVCLISYHDAKTGVCSARISLTGFLVIKSETESERMQDYEKCQLTNTNKSLRYFVRRKM